MGGIVKEKTLEKMSAGKRVGKVDKSGIRHPVVLSAFGCDQETDWLRLASTSEPSPKRGRH